MNPSLQSAGSLRTASLRQIRLPVSDLERSLRFYRGTLGLEMVWLTEVEASLRCGAVDLTLVRSPSRRGDCRLELLVTDPGERDMLRARLLASAAPAALRPEPGPEPGSVMIVDPDGNEIVVKML